jgi:hypothetical protein
MTKRGLLWPGLAAVFVVFFLDWYSTIVQSAAAEENPLVRSVWEQFGNAGFTVFSLVFALSFVGMFWLIYKHIRHPWLRGLALTALFICLSFKLLIALSNFDPAQHAFVMPAYALVAWFRF